MQFDIQFEILNYEMICISRNTYRMQRCYSIDLDYTERWQYNKTQCNVFLQGVKINPPLLTGNFLRVQRGGHFVYTDQEMKYRNVLETSNGNKTTHILNSLFRSPYHNTYYYEEKK